MLKKTMFLTLAFVMLAALMPAQRKSVMIDLGTLPGGNLS